MIPFSLKVIVYRLYMMAMKLTTRILPFPRPTPYSGPGAAKQLCESLANDGVKRVLIVTDAMLVKIGLVEPLREALTGAGVTVDVFDGVEPDPSIEQIEAGVDRLKAIDAQVVLAIGGGSSIDAAKIIAARGTNNKPVRKMEGLFRVFRKPVPLYAVPTTAGTGSEVTIAAVVSDPERKKKMSVIDLKLAPQGAALDGSLMTGLPPHITAATGMDALTHAVEAYISRNATAKTDKEAIEATRAIMEYLPKVMADGSDLDARQKMAHASYQAGIAFTQAGVGYVHAISHNFGARYHTPHGLANAIVLPYVLDYSKPNCAHRLADLARVSGIEGNTDMQLAEAFIKRIRAMNAEFGIPEKLDALQESDIPDIAAAAMAEAHWTYAVPRYMDRATCENFVRQIGPAAATAQAA